MKIASIIGARPQFIKFAGVSRAFRRYASSVQEVVIHTGQHYDTNMSDIFFHELGLAEPTYNLGVGSGQHGAQTGDMLREVERVLLQERPAGVAVYGDTNSTLAGALAAAKLCIPVVHVEAGLRSFNRNAPEEINRILTDHVSTLLLCPTATAVRNLAAEGLVEGVALVGNVMYDALVDNLERADRTSTVLARLGVEQRGYCLVTVHRAENTDDPRRMTAILGALQQLSRMNPVVWPIHPRTRARLEAMGRCPVEGEASGLRTLGPLSYHDMLVLEQHARVILTDSGGVTQEAFWSGVPCITLRDETEWPETVASGWNTLVGTDPRRIVDAAMRPPGDRVARREELPDRGACERVAAALAGLTHGACRS